MEQQVVECILDVLEHLRQQFRCRPTLEQPYFPQQQQQPGQPLAASGDGPRQLPEPLPQGDRHWLGGLDLARGASRADSFATSARQRVH